MYCLHVCRYFFSVFSLVVLPVFIFFGFDFSLNTACQGIPLFSVPRRIGVYLRGIFFLGLSVQFPFRSPEGSSLLISLCRRGFVLQLPAGEGRGCCFPFSVMHVPAVRRFCCHGAACETLKRLSLSLSLSESLSLSLFLSLSLSLLFQHYSLSSLFLEVFVSLSFFLLLSEFQLQKMMISLSVRPSVALNCDLSFFSARGVAMRWRQFCSSPNPYQSYQWP